MSVELIVVCGMPAAGVEAVVQHLRRQCRGTVVVHHDLRQVATGVVQRQMRSDSHTETITVELAHGCLSCALRVDVLPLWPGPWPSAPAGAGVPGFIPRLVAVPGFHPWCC